MMVATLAVEWTGGPATSRLLNSFSGTGASPFTRNVQVVARSGLHRINPFQSGQFRDLPPCEAVTEGQDPNEAYRR